MAQQLLIRVLLAVCLVVAISVSALAQAYPPTGGGGTSTGSTSGSTGGYGGSGAAIGVGVGAAAGVGILYLALHNKGSVVGCVESSTDGIKLMNEKDKNTYALVGGGSTLQPGQRVELKGTRGKDKSGKRTFQVRKLARNYGSCNSESALSSITKSHQ